MIRWARALCCLFLCTSAVAAPQLGLVPAPASLEVTSGTFKLPQRPRIVSSDARVAPVADYARSLLQQFGVNAALGTKPRDGSILLELEQSSADPEAYRLEVSPQRVVIAANDVRGLRYGVVTLWQLLSARPAAKQIPALRIADQPRLRWRGLLLDSARHYQSPQFIERFLDQMALHKLNVLHWHLTDDQAWRLEIKQYPKLTEIGAWRVPAGAGQRDLDPATGQPRRYGGFYSQQQVRDIVAYAAKRGITVVPEIEMPGHASAAIVAYPQLGVDQPGLQAVPADWGVYSNLFNVEESTFEFLQNVLDEVMALFPSDFIHVGGDEAVKDQWRDSPAVQSRMRELGLQDEHALQSYFIQRMGKFLQQRGRRLIGWDEILEGGLAPNATVMSWRGLDGAVAAAAAGHDTVLAPWPTLYLDNRNSDAPLEPPGRGRVISLRDIYSFDPLPASLANAQQHVIGVQANLWTEHIRTEARVEHMAFPRAAALAEVAWTPASRRNWDDFAARLGTQMQRYARQGIGHATLDGVTQPAQHPRSRQARSSHELRLCSDKLVLALEDDAPFQGERAVFLVDIMDPCWIYPEVDLAALDSLSIDIGQVPFNFQIGADVNGIPVQADAARPELEVRAGDCNGERLASVAVDTTSDVVRRLPPLRIAAASGVRDLCLRFTRAKVDPIWVIDRVQLNPKTTP